MKQGSTLEIPGRVPVTIPAVILAAGASRRLGRPKQLLRLSPAGENLLERAIRLAGEAGLAPVIVVLGANYEAILADSSCGDAVVVINAEWAEGMASSIRLGTGVCCEIAPEAAGLVLMGCDQPAVSADHLRLLVAMGVLSASEYAGRRGIPAYFPAFYLETLVSLRGETGAREVLREARACLLVDGEMDIDTPEDLERVLAK